MKIISRIYRVIIALQLFIGAYSPSIMAIDPIKRPTADELLAQIPAIQNATNTLKSVDDQLYKMFLKDMEDNRREFLNMLYALYPTKLEADNLPAITISGQMESMNWVQKSNDAYMAALKKENHTDAQKAKALADIRTAQATMLNPLIDYRKRALLAAYFQYFELLAWQYYDPIWNKQVYAPEVDKMGILAKKAAEEKVQQPQPPAPTTQQLDALKSKLQSVKSSLSSVGWALTTDGKDAVPYTWQDIVNNLIATLTNASLYTTTDAQAKVTQELATLQNTLINTGLSSDKRKTLLRYWNEAVLPVWQYFNPNFANATIKPALDKMRVP